MTKAKRKARGESLPIDRTVPVVGRLKFACGSHIPAVQRKWNSMITELADLGRFDLLRDVRDSRKRRAVIFDFWQRRKLAELPSGSAGDPLIPAMREWVKNRDDIESAQRRQIGYNIDYIERAAPKGAIVSDLPAILDGLRVTKAKTKRAFNSIRSTALVFARMTLKKGSPVHRAVDAVERLPEKQGGKKKAIGKPYEVAEFVALYPSPDTDPLDSAAWSMAMNGMGQKEYWGPTGKAKDHGEWKILLDRIHIGGTKAKGRDRDIPRVYDPKRPTLHRRTVENWLKKRAPNHVCYDLRRSFMHWMEEAGISRTRRQMYMGHSVGGVSGLYEKHEVDAYLIADAGKLKAYIKQETP